MSVAAKEISHHIKEPKGLSDRIKKLRDYYFKGVERIWNNESTSWTTGTPWDVQFNEMTFYIVPETYMLMQTLLSSYRQGARPVVLPDDFWKKSLVERQAWFIKQVMVNYVPKEILPGDLIAGGRFNIQASMCLTEAEQAEFNRLTTGKNGARQAVFWFHGHGYGNAGATSGHLIPGYERMLIIGWRGIYQELENKYAELSDLDKQGAKGAQLKAMMISATMPRDLAGEYAKVCQSLAVKETDPDRKAELMQMVTNLEKVPWEPPKTFWEAVQALWLTHMLIMSDENYPGPGVSFGRIDQYLLPFWRNSIKNGMSREFGKEILKCFWVHANTAYDAMIRNGNQGITAGFGQLITLSGLGKDGPNLTDMTNDLTYAILEVIDEMTPDS